MDRHTDGSAGPGTRSAAESGSFRWGVLGTGPEAQAFVDALHRSSSGRVVAVGSREQGRASGFALPLGIHRAYSRYDAVISDPAVDAIYIARADAHGVAAERLARQAGKHVLLGWPTLEGT